MEPLTAEQIALMTVEEYEEYRHELRTERLERAMTFFNEDDQALVEELDRKRLRAELEEQQRLDAWAARTEARVRDAQS